MPELVEDKPSTRHEYVEVGDRHFLPNDVKLPPGVVVLHVYFNAVDGNG
jgi:hypothetical protein